MGSKSGVSTVTSYSQNNGGTSIFLTKNLIMNIQTKTPVLHVIHALVAFITSNANDMTFR